MSGPDTSSRPPRPDQRCRAAAGIELTADEIAALDEASKPPPEYPGWMLERQGVGR